MCGFRPPDTAAECPQSGTVKSQNQPRSKCTRTSQRGKRSHTAQACLLPDPGGVQGADRRIERHALRRLLRSGGPLAGGWPGLRLLGQSAVEERGTQARLRHSRQNSRSPTSELGSDAVRARRRNSLAGRPFAARWIASCLGALHSCRKRAPDERSAMPRSGRGSSALHPKQLPNPTIVPRGFECVDAALLCLLDPHHAQGIAPRFSRFSRRLSPCS